MLLTTVIFVLLKLFNDYFITLICIATFVCLEIKMILTYVLTTIKYPFEVFAKYVMNTYM